MTSGEVSNALTAARLKEHLHHLGHVSRQAAPNDGWPADEAGAGGGDAADGLTAARLRGHTELLRGDVYGGASSANQCSTVVGMQGSALGNSTRAHSSNADKVRGTCTSGDTQCTNTLESLMKSQVVDQRSIQELLAFRRNLDNLLIRAYQIFGPQQSDTDLADEVRRLGLQVRDLVNEAASVITNRVCILKQLQHAVVPSLASAAAAAGGGDGKVPSRTNIANLVGSVHTWAASMRKDTKYVRKSYVFLLDRVCYAMRCTDLALDKVYQISCGPLGDNKGAVFDENNCPPADEVSGAGAAPETPADMCVGAEPSLTEAMFRLSEVQHMLEDCSDFWLEIYGCEQAFERMEACARQLRPVLLLPSRSAPQLPDQLLQFCGFVESICSQYGREDAKTQAACPLSASGNTTASGASTRCVSAGCRSVSGASEGIASPNNHNCSREP